MELTPKTTLHLLGRDWHWVYNLRTIFEFDKLTGKTFFLLRLTDLSSEDWTKFIYTGIHGQDPKLTFEHFVEQTSVAEVSGAVFEVMNLLFSNMVPKESEGDGGDPTKASPPSTG